MCAPARRWRGASIGMSADAARWRWSRLSLRLMPTAPACGKKIRRNAAKSSATCRRSPLTVSGDRLQVAEDFAAFRRIFFPHAGAVGISLSDNLLQRHRAASALIPIEAPRQRRAGAHITQRRNQLERVVQPAVQPHAAGRTAEMGRITGERDAPAVIVGRDALVDAIWPLL